MASRDQTVKAFLKYARLGLDRRSFSSIEITSRLRGCCRSDAEAISLLAVYDMLRMLEAVGKKESADAVRAVYFFKKGRALRKNDVSFAVRRFAAERHMDERTVWRRIGEAKTLYSMLLKGQNICS